MPINIFTCMYGAHYINLFKTACFRSLNWTENRKALIGSTWNIATKREHFEELDKLFANSGFELHLFEIGESTRVAGVGYVPTKQCDGGVIILDKLRQQMQICLVSKQRMLLAPPDTMFGDGTIPNLIALGSVPGTCVAVAHPRVLPTIIEETEYLAATRGGITNAQLVTLMEKHAHSSWKYAEVGHEKNNSFIGGISWRSLGPGAYSVTHRLPTIYLADFNNTDWDFWWGQVSFGSWDHRWPAENLLRQERQRYVGSSDACMIVEITDHDKNVPPETSQKHPEPDGYWNNHYHNGINRQTSVIFRGE